MTIKNFNQLHEAKAKLKRQDREETRKGQFALSDATRKLIQEIDTELDKLEKVYVSYMIGSRSYYEEATKIGKSLFYKGRKLTRSNGYSCVTIIPAITDEMRESMLSDSYYY